VKKSKVFILASNSPRHLRLPSLKILNLLNQTQKYFKTYHNQIPLNDLFSQVSPLGLGIVPAENFQGLSSTPYLDEQNGYSPSQIKL
jgi:hypothetical protein